jgi:hypothetical protein
LPGEKIERPELNKRDVFSCSYQDILICV